jgi:hypothetical protein
MNARRFQGIILIISAGCLLLGRFLPETLATRVISIIGTILFIMGIPAIQAAQPEGIIGWTGIGLLEIGALIALAFQLDLAAGSGLALASALAGMLGRAITGWLTARAGRFPAWAGWMFLLSGVFTLVGGFVGLGTAGLVLAIISILLETFALLGYGTWLSRNS